MNTKGRIDKNKNRNKNLLRLSAALSALGAGSYALGRGLISPQMQESMNRFKNIDFETPDATLANYAIMGSDLMNQDLLYGAIKPIDFVRTLRSYPVRDTLIRLGLMDKSFEEFKLPAYEHYSNYTMGPLHGIAKALDETLSGVSPHGTPEKETQYATAVEKTRAALNSFIKEKTGISDYFNRNLNENIDKTSKGMSYPIHNITRYAHLPTLDRQKQTQLALQLPEWLKNNKNLKDINELFLKTNQNAKTPARAYRNMLIEPIENISSATKLLGAGLGLAGIGLGSYGLYRYLKNKKQEKLQQEKDKELDQNAL